MLEARRPSRGHALALVLCAFATGCADGVAFDGATDAGVPPEFPLPAAPAVSCDGLPAGELGEIFKAHFAASAPAGCALSGCHGTGAGGLTFKTADELYAAVVDQPSLSRPGLSLVKPGNPSTSTLYLKLAPNAVGRMPPSGPYLDDEALRALAGWICRSAPPPESGGTDGGTDGGHDGPIIVGLEPASGPVGTPVRITGSGFSVVASENAIDFNGAVAAASAATESALDTFVPAGASTGLVRVTVNGRSGASPVVFEVVTIRAVPVLTGISPNTIDIGGTPPALVARGSAFDPSSVVELDGAPLATSFVSATELRATLPASALTDAGTRVVSVRTPPPGGGTSASMPLQIVYPAPAIDNLVPASVRVGSGAATVQIKGGGFLAVSQVTLNGATATSRLVDASTLELTLGAGLTANAGTLSVVVTNPAPGGGASAPATLAITNPAPVLTRLSPATVNAGSGGLTLTLEGSDFLPNSRVELDGAALPATFVDATKLAATLDAALTASGAQRMVVVINPAPGGGASQSRAFTVTNPAPVLSAISPASVGTGGASFILTATGSGFVPSSEVLLDGAPLTTTWVDTATLTATVPTINSPGGHLVTVRNQAPGGGTSAAQTLTASSSQAPGITGLSPNPGPENAVFRLTITGSGFNCAGGTASRIFVDGAAAGLVPASCSSTSLGVDVGPFAAGGAGNAIQVKNGATSASNVATLQIVAPNPIPSLTRLLPDTVLQGSSALTLEVEGSNFVQGAVVRLSGSARPTTFVSATRVTAALSSSDFAAVGQYPVTVVNPAPGGGESAATALKVIAGNPVPVIASLTPSGLATGSGGGSVTVGGSGFTADSVAHFDGSPRTTSFVSATALTLQLIEADTAIAGSFPVTVTNPAPGGGTSNAFSLAIADANPVPTLSSISPGSGTAGASSLTLTATGSDFVNGCSVQFNGVPRSTTFTSSSQVSAVLSQSDLAVAGSHSVSVSNPSPGGGASNALTFTLDNPAPAIASLSPASIAAGSPSFALTVNGSGFVSASSVLLDGSPRTTRLLGPGQLSADLVSSDVASTGTRSITVVNPGPGGGTSTAATLTVTAAANPAPRVDSIEPCGVAAGAGQFTLTIRGANFVAGSTATFNGTALQLTAATSTQLTATVPASLVASAPAGNVVSVAVTNAAPGGGSSSADFGVASRQVTLAADVQQLFTGSCTSSGCHTGGTLFSLRAGEAWASVVGVPSADCAPTLLVKACSPRRSTSVVIDKILASPGSPACSGSPMPKGAPLTTAEKQLIIDWVALGAPK